MQILWTHREVKRFIEIKVNGKKKKVKSVKLYLDFSVMSDFGTLSYTAHVYSDGRNRPEIRIKDPRGNSRDVDKHVSRDLADFAKENRYLAGVMPEIVAKVQEAHAAKLATSIARWEVKANERRVKDGLAIAA